MRISFLITSLAYGGAEKYVCKLLNEMKGYEVELISLTKIDFDFLDKNLERQVEVKEFNLKSIFFAFNLMRLLFFLSKKKVVFSHMIHANLISLTIAMFFPRKRVVVVAHSENEGKLSWFYKAFNNQPNTRYVHISPVGLSKYICQKYFPPSAVCIPNCVDFSKFDENKKYSNSVFLFVGRLVKLKNVDNLIRIFKAYVDLNNQAKFIIAGDGPERESLEGLVSYLNISKNVEFSGYVNPQELYRKADYLLMGSDFEGFPTVILEAIENGVIPVVNNLDIFHYLSAISDSFFVCESDDEYIYTFRLLENKELKELAIENYRAFSKTFSTKTILRSYEEIFKK